MKPETIREQTRLNALLNESGDDDEYRMKLIHQALKFASSVPWSEYTEADKIRFQLMIYLARYQTERMDPDYQPRPKTKSGPTDEQVTQLWDYIQNTP